MLYRANIQSTVWMSLTLVKKSHGFCVVVNLPLHHKVQKFCSGTGSPGWSRKKGRKTVVLVVSLADVIVGVYLL